ncbi:hypothetical protein B5807_12135 [Epicoccum nigrum]|uniref:Uncharacterized protein n=1 Tax=Epicoccum nigrum TaxID=105696 RepID=A0A1Y2LH03_EPING|nr:hypothetical protein B5807_12135 [Epicoccum nigrum]
MPAAEDAGDRRRRRNTGVDEVTDYEVHMGLGDPAPDPPQMHPLNAEYCLNRASRPQNSYQDNYDDAYQYMYGRRLGHPRTVPVDGHHDPREYAGPILRFGLNGRRNRDLATSRWDRIRNWS